MASFRELLAQTKTHITEVEPGDVEPRRNEEIGRAHV